MDEELIKKVKEMYDSSQNKYKETGITEWEAYTDGIHDTLYELKIFIEGVNK